MQGSDTVVLCTGIAETSALFDDLHVAWEGLQVCSAYGLLFRAEVAWPILTAFLSSQVACGLFSWLPLPLAVSII